MNLWASAERHELRSRSMAEEAVMQNQPDRIYNSDDLAMLSRILEETLEETVNGAVLTELQIRE